jgi:dienelactone hydrolase
MRTPLASGAEARVTNEAGTGAVVLVDGGQGRDVPGTWSATLEWLARRLAPSFPRLTFVEVRYRLKSWRRLDMCAEDARAGIDVTDAARCALVGFSMGGAVAIKAASHPSAAAVIGLAPWIPDRLDLSPLENKRFAVIHGTLDRYLPGVPGVSPVNSRRGYDRARRSGVLDGEYTLIPGGLHGVAVRGPLGLVPLPRASRWAELLATELERFQDPAG